MLKRLIGLTTGLAFMAGLSLPAAYAQPSWEKDSIPKQHKVKEKDSQKEIEKLKKEVKELKQEKTQAEAVQQDSQASDKTTNKDKKSKKDKKKKKKNK